MRGDLAPERRVLRHGGAQQFTGGDVLDAERLGHADALRALAAAGRSEHQDSHVVTSGLTATRGLSAWLGVARIAAVGRAEMIAR